MIADYTIISDSSSAKVSEQVREYLKNGYHTAGGVFVEHSETQALMFHQAVYKVEKTDKTSNQ